MGRWICFRFELCNCHSFLSFTHTHTQGHTPNLNLWLQNFACCLFKSSLTHTHTYNYAIYINKHWVRAHTHTHICLCVKNLQLFVTYWKWQRNETNVLINHMNENIWCVYVCVCVIKLLTSRWPKNNSQIMKITINSTTTKKKQKHSNSAAAAAKESVARETQSESGR